MKPLNNSNSDKAFREQNLAGKFDKFQPHYFCETLPKKSSTPVFGGHPVAKSGRTSVPCFKTCKHSLAKMLAKILAQFRPSKLQPQLFGEIHGNTLCQKHWGKLGYSSAVFLELLGLLNRKTWHISCIYILLFTVSATQLSLHTKNCRSNAVSLWQHSLYPNIGAVEQQFFVHGVPCPALHQLKLCSLQDSVPFTTSCPGSLQADWRRAVYVFKNDMHGKSVLPDVFSNLP